MTAEKDVGADSGSVVVAALIGNLCIAATKLAAFVFSGSAAMLTEAIHSMVDTSDQLLLLYGQKRAARPPDESHPFGYGLETYFWSFVVALLIFLVGGAVSVWQGVEKLRHPAPLERPWLIFLVLGVSAIFEGASFAVGYRAFRRTVKGRPIRLLRFLHLSKDPSLFATLLEDGAALTGLVIAGLGAAGASALGLSWADGAASVAIGALLIAIAAFLANETRSLIAGEAAAQPVVDTVRHVVEDRPDVQTVGEVATLHLGPRAILVALTLSFDPALDRQAIERARAEVATAMRAAEERVVRVYFREPGPDPRSPKRTAKAST